MTREQWIKETAERLSLAKSLLDSALTAAKRLDDKDINRSCALMTRPATRSMRPGGKSASMSIEGGNR